MKNWAHLSSILILGLATSISVYALPTDSTGSGMVFGSTPSTPRVQTIQFGGTTTNNYNPTDTQAFSNGKCGNNQVLVGYSSTDGNFGNFRFTSGVDYDLWESNRNNYTQSLMTSGGARSYTCQTIQMDYY